MTIEGVFTEISLRKKGGSFAAKKVLNIKTFEQS